MTDSTDAVGGQLVPTARQGLAARAVEVAAGGRAARGLAARGRGERGMVSAEWAVGIIATIAIAGVLLTVVTSGPVEKALLAFILMVIRAFSSGL